MLNQIKYALLLLLACVVTSCGTEKPTASVEPTQSKESLLLQQQAELERQDQILGQYAINMMMQTPARSKLSDAKKLVMAHAIVRVANSVFENTEQRKAFIAVLAIESGFERAAQSPTGPRGLTQVAKAAFKEGLGYCGITNFNDEDVWETDINLYAGACYFRSILERNNNDPYVSIVAYNQGPNSDAVKTFSKSGYMENLEALKYVARFSYLKQVVKDTKAPGAPAIQSATQKAPAQGEVK